MTVTEIKETIENSDGQTSEMITFQLDAKEGFLLAKGNYTYGRSVLTDDPNGWIEVPEN